MVLTSRLSERALRKKVGKRIISAEGRVYRIVYLHDEWADKLGMEAGTYIIMYFPPEEDHIELWPADKFYKALKEGRVTL